MRFLRERNDVVALLAILCVVRFVLAKPPPAGIWGLGLVAGSALALYAVGIVLVYRANRIINFAQVGVGATAATLFTVLTTSFPLLRLVTNVCPPCLEDISFADGTPEVSGLAYDVNYALALVLSLGTALAIGYAIHRFVIRRLEAAPRLVVTVATIFIASLLATVGSWLPRVLTTEAQREGAAPDLSAGPVPWRVTLTWEPAQFHAPEILTVLAALAAVAGIALYLRRSATGVWIRAASENPARAATLGVDVASVTSRVWVVAAGLSGLAGIFQAMTAGAPGTTTLSVSLMVRILAVAVIARMVSLPMAAAASAVIGILDQGVLWSSGTLVALDGVLLVIVGGVLALQRVRISRAELEQASEFRAARQVRPTPRELAGHPSVKRWYRTGRVALVVVLLGAPWALTPAQSNLASLVALKAMVGLSLLLLTGWAGQISLGQFAFAAIGGYVVAAWGAPFPIAILAGALAAAGASTLVGLPAVRMRGLHLAITTLAFALSVSALLLNPRYLGGALPASIERPALIGMDLDDERVFYYLTLAFLAAVVAGVLGLRRSRTARALLATRDNEAAAQSFGINLVRLRLSASALSGFVAGLAGGLFAYHQHGVQAQAFAPEESVLIFTIAVLGGLGSITSILTGFAVYAVLLLVGAGTLAQLVFVGGGGLALLMFSPGGLGELVFATRDAILRRLAARENIVVPSLVADIADTDEPRAPIAPNLRSGGGTVFVPPRYRLDDQWAISEEEPV